MTETSSNATAPLLKWCVVFPFKEDPQVVRQLALVIFLPLLLLYLFLLALELPISLADFWQISKVLLAISGFMILLYAFVIVVLFRGRQELCYTLDDEGIKIQSGGIVKHMGIIKLLLVLSGKPTAMGAGMLAQGPTNEMVDWKKVDRVEGNDLEKTITLYKGSRELAVVHCNAENYERVLQRSHEACSS